MTNQEQDDDARRGRALALMHKALALLEQDTQSIAVARLQHAIDTLEEEVSRSR